MKPVGSHKEQEKKKEGSLKKFCKIIAGGLFFNNDKSCEEEMQKILFFRILASQNF